tara:strand:+ start:1150 stop:1749 length:600 start_codon:yes stop_codon:yes gene_type:complete
MKVLVFDTETTGLPSKKGFDQYYPYTESHIYDSSRIVSICWNLYENGNLMNSEYHIVRPNDFEIDNSSIACSINGITEEVAFETGISINDIFQKMHGHLYECDIIVAHNLLFDEHILLAELHRNKRDDLIQIFESKKRYCTMNNSRDILKLPTKFGNNYKSPKLVELYQYFFNKDFDNQHNAKADVDACAQCYFKLTEM